ncbi:hypothetical protein HOY80DRAFT_992603 [Tuber brumale]|nr:hypothetical protein HOY80DRAFT_992603 [Tuber brumale]
MAMMAMMGRHLVLLHLLIAFLASAIADGATNVGLFIFTACLGHDANASSPYSTGSSPLYATLGVLVSTFTVIFEFPRLYICPTSSAISLIALSTFSVTTPGSNSPCSLHPRDSADLSVMRTHLKHLPSHFAHHYFVSSSPIRPFK